MKATLINLLLLCCLSLNNGIYNVLKEKPEVKILTEEEVLYEETIEFIKKAEGLKLMPYRCPAGFRTIGHGHLITANERFNCLDSIEADKLLREDFNERYNYIKSLFPNNHFSKQLAISHFVFCLGSKNLTEELKSRVARNRRIDDIVLQYNKYRNQDSVLVPSANLLRQRKFEVSLYNYEKRKQNNRDKH